MITIELNKKLDYEVYKNFWDFNTAGADFASLIKQDHPSITPENAKQYIDDFYSKNTLILEQSRNDLIDALRDKQGEFFEALKTLFKIDFASNNYNGYISIFDCNPRFVETNEFQVFYKRSMVGKLAVVFHEIMHFAFFEYCKTNLAEKIKDLNTNSGKLWELSEIFNVVVLSMPQFVKITGRKEELFYPELAEKLMQAKTVWNSVSGDAHKFIEESLK